MKRIFSFLILTGWATFSSLAQGETDPLNTIMEDGADFERAVSSFQQGHAKNGEEYFFGVQAAVVEIDVRLRMVEHLDSIDASRKEFDAHYESMLIMIENCKAALRLYYGKGWPKQEKMQLLTFEWVNAVKWLIDDYLKKLAAPMSIPDKRWKEEDFDFYDRYLRAYDHYLLVDDRWVDFQYEFASANGFQLSDELIDMDSLMKEEIGE